MRAGRRWAFRLATLAVAPAFLVLLEGGLRLAGFGHPTAFLVADEIAGRAVLRDNPHFARRFFPPPLYRSPRPFAVARAKDPSAYRVVVLGESAALGDPAPAFGFARILGVMLQHRYPERRVEIVNTAITAINSHAIREIAWECARLQPDVFLVYMGNNEVVGPYGAGTAFHPASQGPGLVRAQLLARRLRLGQLAESLARRLRPAAAPGRWEGMAMFVGHEVAAGEPGLAAVHASFRRNLEDVLDAAAAADAPVLLSTIATNLADQPPFAVKGEDAGAAFARGRELAGQGRGEEAYRELVRARDLDALRFRADSAINQAIRELAAARRSRGVTLLDAEAAVRRASPQGLPGDELLFEHVHFTFEGNYVVAREAALAVAALLPPTERALPPPEECARRLGLTAWHRHELLRAVMDRLRRPPFLGQPGAAERLARLGAQARALAPQLTPAALSAAAQELAAITGPSADWERHEVLADLMDAAGRTEDAVREWDRVLAAVPHDHEALGRRGALLIKAGRPDEALASFEQARRLRPDVADVYNNLGALYAGQGRWAAAEAACRRALARDPGSREALLNLSTALAAQGLAEEARQAYDEAARGPIYSAQVLQALAERAEEAGHLQEAAERYRGALAIEATPAAQAGLAWILATAPDAGLRDGARAVALAEEANRTTGGRDADGLNTLAAAYAEAGRFPEAQAAARQAIEAAEGAGQAELAANIRKLAALYAQGRPYPRR